MQRTAGTRGVYVICCLCYVMPAVVSFVVAIACAILKYIASNLFINISLLNVTNTKPGEEAATATVAAVVEGKL